MGRITRSPSSRNLVATGLSRSASRTCSTALQCRQRFGDGIIAQVHPYGVRAAAAGAMHRSRGISVMRASVRLRSAEREAYRAPAKTAGTSPRGLGLTARQDIALTAMLVLQ